MPPVNAEEVLRQTAAEARRRFRYLAERKPDDHWQTPGETERLGAGDCEDFACWTVCMAHDRMADLGLDGFELRMVVGDVVGRGGHAWVELDQLAGARVWAEPTPDYAGLVDAPGWWTDRTARWAYGYDGMIFTHRYEYQEA